MTLVNTLLLSLLTLLTVNFLAAQYISEFHYDNMGADQGEFVEVMIPDPQPVDLSEYKIYLYRSSNGTNYRNRGLQGIAPACSDGLCFYVWLVNPIQNGPNGIALVEETPSDTTVFDFVSYEGMLIATDGGAKGMTSIDVGLQEDTNTPVGWSLQKRSDGTWIAGPETRGRVNPIELLSFNARFRKDPDGILLEWETASEVNNQYFEIQKSQDQRLFWPVAQVNGAGNSQEILTYTIFDADPYPGLTYYRLKQVDFGGTYVYSRMITVESPSRYLLAEIVPVFRNKELYFMRSEYRHEMEIFLFDPLGKILLHRKHVYTGDVIPVSVALSGIFFFHILSHGEELSGRLMHLTN